MTQLLAKNTKAGREYVRLHVAKLASGADLRLGLHVVTGAKPGPTLGILTTIHGDETMPLMVVRELLSSLDVASLSGRVAAIPTANPLAVSVFNRQTPEQHGRTDLHEVFPGNPQGNLTQRMASVITTNLLDHVDALVDIHCGGSGGRLQSSGKSRRFGASRSLSGLSEALSRLQYNVCACQQSRRHRRPILQRPRETNRQS